uniref:Uncharacterized protein n=1 Tax=Oryza sativa subsp. japonica TaxID=39947 RepID=Q5W660_ORYSJ|nr:hypothetical protein [Oryza sativa Japonica Group]AAV44097.1 hypothetical protein [Oryza sativa Japonica Group]
MKTNCFQSGRRQSRAAQGRRRRGFDFVPSSGRGGLPGAAEIAQIRASRPDLAGRQSVEAGPSGRDGGDDWRCGDGGRRWGGDGGDLQIRPDLVGCGRRRRPLVGASAAAAACGRTVAGLAGDGDWRRRRRQQLTVVWQWLEMATADGGGDSSWRLRWPTMAAGDGGSSRRRQWLVMATADNGGGSSSWRLRRLVMATGYGGSGKWQWEEARWCPTCRQSLSGGGASVRQPWIRRCLTDGGGGFSVASLLEDVVLAPSCCRAISSVFRCGLAAAGPVLTFSGHRNHRRIDEINSNTQRIPPQTTTDADQTTEINSSQLKSPQTTLKSTQITPNQQIWTMQEKNGGGGCCARRGGLCRMALPLPERPRFRLAAAATMRQQLDFDFATGRNVESGPPHRLCQVDAELCRHAEGQRRAPLRQPGTPPTAEAAADHADR